MVNVLFELYYQAMCQIQHFGYLSRLCANLLICCFIDFVTVQPIISTLYHNLQVVQSCVTTIIKYNVPICKNTNNVFKYFQFFEFDSFKCTYCTNAPFNSWVESSNGAS
jgi:hypothetical protein